MIFKVNSRFSTLVITLIANFAFQTLLFSQLTEPQPKFNSYTVEDGLPSSETYFIHQDKKGFIWICTDRGVVQFDGYKFKLFTKAQGLTDNVVFKIYEDFKGRIWFLTYNSKLCYFENNRIVKYKYNYLIEKNGLGFISVNKNLFVDSNETIYFSELFNGLTIIDKGGRLLHEHPKQGMTISKRSNQIFWTFKLSLDVIKKGDAIRVFNDDGKRLIEMSSIMANSRISVSSAKAGDFILLEGKLFNLRNNQLVANIEDAISINIIDSSLWIGRLKGGVYHFPNINNLSTYSNYLKKYSVTSIMKDKEGGFWFSTLEKGIFYSPSMAIKNYSLNEGLIDEDLISIAGIKNNIYIGYLTGKWQNIYYPAYSNYLKTTNFRTVLGNSKDEIYISTKNTQKLISGKLSKKILNVWSADFFYQAPNMYFGNQGIYKVNFNGEITELYHHSFDITKDKKNQIQAIMVDPSQTVWVGTLKGLYFLDGKHLSKKGLINSLFKERVSDLVYHPFFKNIVATRGEGIYFFHKGKIFRRFTNKDGLLSNIINVLYLDQENGLWVGTSKGLNYILLDDKGQIKIESFTTFHGLCSNEITSVYRYKQLVYVATKNGLAVIDLLNFKRNHSANKLSVTHFETTNMNFNPLKFNILSSGESVVKLSFRNDNYRTLQVGLYQYRLNKNSKWITTSIPDITLINPLPGIYDLEVKYQNEDGIWSKSQHILYFAIDQIFYKKPIFLLISFLFLSLIVYLIFRFRIKQIKKKHFLNSKINHLEQKALQAQMNPHFIFNALNSIQSFLVYEENIKAEKYLLTFSQLIRQTLSNSREPNISIQNEIEILEKYLELEKMRFRDKFAFEIHLNLRNHELSKKIPNMLIQPFVENAVIHGFSTLESGGKIDVFIESVDENQIRCIVEDNGIGRRKALQQSNKDHISFATTITEERLKAFEKKHRIQFKIETIDIFKNDGTTGTKVIINLPLI